MAGVNKWLLANPSMVLELLSPTHHSSPNDQDNDKDQDNDIDSNKWNYNDNEKDNPKNLWPLKHFLQFWQLRIWIRDNLCDN